MGYSAADSTKQKFTQKERDNESGLDYFLARYYSGAQGRFASVDPGSAGAFLSDPQSWNGYAYARNNPLVYVDPDGRTFRLCDSDGNCQEISDADADEWRKKDGVIFKGGKIFDKDGNQLGTYERIWFDDLTDDANRLIFGLAARAPEMLAAIRGFAGLSIRGGLAVGSGGTFLLLGSLGEIAVDYRMWEDQQEAQAAIGSIDTTSETRNAALREAKKANGVSVSAQPDQVIMPGTPEGEAAGLRPNDNVRLYEYTNANGQKVWIREDRAVAYPDGGTQGPHFNSGPKGGKLSNHHYFRRR
jgi:RHS repeat-associated protein